MGYTEYRYGLTKPITLAGGPRRPEPVVRGQARESLIDRVMEAMGDWRKSPFEHEGSMRAGLRSAWCLDGNDWSRADYQAAVIVSAALDRMGAARPSFEQAQRGYASGSDYCHWCFRPIDEDDRSRGRRFCSPDCARTALEYMARETNHHYGAVLRSAIRLLDIEKAEPQTCSYCERTFKADRHAKYCSTACTNAAARIHEDRHCAMCSAIFRPVNRDQRHCSQSCSRRAAMKAEAEALAGVRLTCEACGGSFQPRHKSARYCSSKCQQYNGTRLYRERRRPLPPRPTPCGWCGEVYQPKIKLRDGVPGYCSPRCNKDASRFKSGWVPRELTSRVFDRYFTCPANELAARRVTAAKLDWWFMEQGLRVTHEREVA